MGGRGTTAGRAVTTAPAPERLFGLHEVLRLLPTPTRRTSERGEW